jgi:hypothetical protein
MQRHLAPTRFVRYYAFYYATHPTGREGDRMRS